MFGAFVRGAGGQNVGLYIEENRTGMSAGSHTFQQKRPIGYLKNFPSGPLGIQACTELINPI